MRREPASAITAERLGGAEVVGVHVGHVGLRVGGPDAHPVRVGPGVVLHRGRGPTVGVALAQHRVDRAAHHPVVAAADLPLLVGPWVVGHVGQRIAVALQLGDGRLELRARGRDVGQLDDVGLRRVGQGAQLGQGVADALALLEPLGEAGDDPAGQRDVPGLDDDARGGGVGLDHRQEGVRGQGRGLVGVGVDDGRVSHRCSTSGRLGARNDLTWLLGHHPGPVWRNLGDPAERW